MKPAVVLGAGFSAAVSPLMPMTGRLGELVLQRLAAENVKVPSRTFSGPQLEAWLSRLAEPQPDLDEAQNLENRALFLRVSQALRDVLVESQMQVFDGEPPWWLLRLIGFLHYTSMTTMTFNYDTIIEATVAAANLFDQDQHRVSGDDLVRRMPPVRPLATGGLTFGPHEAATFRYIKLHGSVDTYWIPNDVTGATMARWSGPGSWGHPVVESDERRRQALPGTSPFIVPPAAAKSAFYNNPLTRELWQSAARALREADDVALVGYSIPMTDLVTSGMLADTLGDRTKVTVVNPCPEPVVARLGELGIPEENISVVAGNDCVRTYVERAERDLAPATDFGSDNTYPLAVGQGGRQYPVTGLVGPVRDGTARVKAIATTSGMSSALTPSVTLDDLREHGPLHRIEVDYGADHISTVVRITPSPGPSGATECLLLTPTVIPRELAAL